MATSDEFIPDEVELGSLLARVFAPEISATSRELGIEPSYRAHAFARGKESLVVGEATSAWGIRAVFRAAHAPGRVLVQVQAMIANGHPSGFSGFIIKGAYYLGNPESFSARSRVNIYNNPGFRGWT